MSVRRVLLILLISFFLVGGVILDSASSYQNLNLESRDLSRKSDLILTEDYILHDPIVIESNADFALQGWPGEGTKSDPYVIAGLNITDSGEAVSISNTDVYFIIRDCFLTSMTIGMNFGLQFNNVENATIQTSDCVGPMMAFCRNINISDCELPFGLYFQESSFCSVRNSNLMLDLALGGINQNITIANNSIQGIIRLAEAVNCTIDRNEIFNTWTAIELQYSEDITVSNNNIFNYTGTGLEVYYAVNCKIVNNTLVDPGTKTELNDNTHCSESIRYAQATNCSLINNTIGKAGVSFFGYPEHYRHVIEDNYIEDKKLGYFWNKTGGVIDGTEYGQIILSECEEVEIIGGSFNRVVMPLQILVSTNCTITNATASFSSYGILSEYSSYTTIQNSTITDAGHGIFLYGNYNKIYNCTISRCEEGVYLVFGSGTTVVNCTLIDNFEGFELVGNYDGTFVNNTFVNCGIHIDRPESVSAWDHVIENNTVNGKELGYFWNQHNLSVNGDTLGQILMANCENVSITEGDLYNSSLPVQIAFCTNISIDHMSISNSPRGIELINTINCSVDRCTLLNLTSGGIETSGVGDIISNCILTTFVGNSFFPISGPRITVAYENIYHDPGSCLIINNTITTGYMGIYIGSEDCSVINNTVVARDTGINIVEPGTLILNNTVSNTYYAMNLADNCIVSGNYFENITWFYEGFVGNNVEFCENTVVNCEGGFSIPGSNWTFSDNTLVNTSLSMEGPIDNYRHEVFGNTVNGKPLGYIWNATSAVFDLNDYGQLILVNGTNLIVSANTPIDGYAGVSIDFSRNCVVQDIEFNNSFGTQASFKYSEDVVIQNVVIENSKSSIFVYQTANATVTGNEVSNSLDSIRAIYSPYMVIQNNDVEGCEDGISVNHCDNSNIIDNSIVYSTSFGLNIDSSYGVEVINNSISNNDGEGIRVNPECEDITITECMIFNNTLDGISFYEWDLWYIPAGVNNGIITQNEIYDNGGYGINLQQYTTNISIYNNGIGWNEKGNSRDDDTTLSNNWDNGINQGNWWSDYNEDGIYLILGGNVDRYPRNLLALSSPNDIQFEVGVIGQEIEWTSEGLHPNHYEVSINGAIGEAGESTNPIVVSLDGLSTGTYNYTILLYDTYGHYVCDSVIVTVIPNSITTTSTTTSSTEFDPLILVIGGLSAVVVIVIIVVLIKKKQ